MKVTKILSIEITDVCTRVCLMDYHKKNPVIYKSTIFENPEGTVEDGFVVEREPYERALRRQLKATKMMYPDVAFTLASNKILTREAAVPDMKDDKILELIRNERSAYFPIDTNEHVFAFDTLGKIKEEKKLRVMIYAVPRGIIMNMKALTAEMGFNLVAIGCTGNSVMRYLSKPDIGDMELYLQINERNTLFTIMHDHNFALQRNMAFGTEVYDGTKTILDATKPLLANLGNVLDYYTSRNKDINVSTIYLGGLGSHVTGIKEVIEHEFNGIEVVLLETLPSVRIKETNMMCLTRSTEFTACIGLAEANINFYIENVEKQLNKTLRNCIIGFVVTLAASILIVYNGKMKYDEAVARNERLTKKNRELKAEGIDRIENDTVNEVRLLMEVERADAETETFTDAWSQVLTTLEQGSLKKEIVTSVNSAETGMTLNIVVGTKVEAAKVILLLKEMDCFSEIIVNGVTFSSSSEEEASTASFTALCEYGEHVYEDPWEMAERIIGELGLTDLEEYDVMRGLEDYLYEIENQ